MNYDLFIPASAVDRAHVPVSSERTRSRAPQPDLGVRRADATAHAGTAVDRPPRDSASEPPTTAEVENAVSAFNDVFEQANVGVRYRVDQSTDDLVISLVNRDTKEVIRQIPPDQILQMRQRLEELMGVMFDTTA